MSKSQKPKTLYNLALQIPEKAVYIKKLQLQPCDEHLLWIIDNLTSATAPQDDSRQYFENFYFNLLNNLLKSSKLMQYNSLEFIFTQRPPLAIRNLIEMCAYLQIDISSPYLYLAMVAIALPTPQDYVLQNNEYMNIKTKEVQQVHPADIILQQWRDRQIQQQGYQIVPRLTAEEKLKIGSNFVCLFDFKKLKIQFVGKHDIFQPNLVSIVLFKEELLEQQLLQRPELKGALIEANEAVFQAAQGEILPESCNFDKILEIINVQNGQKSRQQYIKEQCFQKQREDFLSSHFVIKLQQEALPIIQVDRQFVYSKLLSSPPEVIRFQAYKFVSKRSYALITQNQNAFQKREMSQLQLINDQIQMRLQLFISQSELDITKFGLNSSIIGATMCYNELNEFPYPYEGQQPTAFNVKIGYSVTCRGLCFVLTQADASTLNWFRDCGNYLSKLSSFLKFDNYYAEQVKKGKMSVQEGADILIKQFYQAQADGTEVFAEDLTGVIEQIRNDLGLTL